MTEFTVTIERPPIEHRTPAEIAPNVRGADGMALPAKNRGSADNQTVLSVEAFHEKACLVYFLRFARFDNSGAYPKG